MLTILKRKKQIFILLLLLLVFLFSHGQDTVVRRKYIDSLKNELAMYTVSSYQYLNWYDRSQEELRKANQRYQIGQQQFNYILYRRRKENIYYGVAFGFLMILSFTSVVMFSKNN